jgi:anti-sigma-K factor RskA
MDESRRAMPHDEAAGELAAAALGALPPDTMDAVLAHVQGCAACAAELASLRAVAARLDERDEAAADPARAAAQRGRLVDRARADRANAVTHEVHDMPQRSRRSTPGAPAVITEIPRAPRGGHPHHDGDRGDQVIVPTAMAHRRRTSRPWLMPAAALAASAGFVLAGLGYLAAREDVRRLRAQLSVAERTRAADVAVLESALREREAEMRRLTGPSVRVVELASSGASLPHARMFWDVASSTWTLVGHRVPRLPAGRTYQVWLVTANQKLSAGTFEPSSSGEAVYRTRFPLEASALTAVAITVEPEGGVPVATGPIVMLGEVRGR